jgi:hypothetical protein
VTYLLFPEECWQCICFWFVNLHQKAEAYIGPALRLDGPLSGLSTVAAWTVYSCAESVRVPDFLRNLLDKPARSTREPTCNGSRHPPFT